MKTNLKLIFYLLAFALIGCNTTCDCEKITSSSTYNEAVTKAKDCGASDSETTSKSSWIRKISFYRCDENKGFLIMQTDKGEYIHSGVPKTVWNDFKNADSFGEFYNRNLRGHFQFILKK